MIEKIIEQIKDSENKSKELISSAKKEHNEIIEKAYQESAEIENQAKIGISKMYRDYEEKAVNDSKAEIEKIRSEYDKKTSEVERIASAKKQAAVDYIIGKVIQ